MIVKIQVPLATNGKALALIYNKDQSFTTQIPVTKDLEAVMDGEPKAYFKVEVVKDSIKLVERVPTQQW
jgi:hypothetical protein